ncbi:MAG: ZIP family metal transporter [Flavobacteriaceae bacterium]|jgi:zinc transporter ZupT|nr:ZIP family metal transporter [Flavobacteriaceae bacterium LSUCC0859]
MTYILPILAVLLSFFGVYAIKPKSKHYIKLCLAFSGAFLLAVILFELFPEIYEHQQPKLMGLFVMLGILLQIILEFFSKGAEHGHVHLDKKSKNIPWALFISLSIHAFLEGIPAGGHSHLLYGIVVHKLTVAIILSIFLLQTAIPFKKALGIMLAFSLMTPLGSFLSTEVALAAQWSNALTALVIGVLLHIATVILFESSEGHAFNLRKIIVILLGIGTAYLL